MKYKVKKATKRNNLKNIYKPNEDYLLCNTNNNLFIVADGVSRDLVDGKYPIPSPSSDISKISCHLLNSLYETGYILDDIIKKVNNEINNYNTINGYNLFLPGTVLSILEIKDNKLFLTYIGDCPVYLIRNGKKSKVTQPQTLLIHKHKKKFTSNFIRNSICNNKAHPYSYGVLNGNESALNFIEKKEFKLEKNDIIIIASDGLEHFLDSNNIDKNFLDPYNIISFAEEEEENEKSDDKTIIIIEIQEL